MKFTEPMTSRLTMGLIRGFRRSQRRLCLLVFGLVSCLVTYVLITRLPLGDSPQRLEIVQFISSSQGQACIQPKLKLYPDQSFRQLFWNVPKTPCVGLDWLYVENSTVRFNPEARRRYGHVTCDVIPLVREDEFNTIEGSRIRAIRDGAKIPADFFKAACFAKGAARLQQYENYHAGISPVPSKGGTLSTKALGLNVLMFGFDSVSRLTWMRKLPKTYDYLVNSLHAVVLEGYNIVGDGTPQALLPILTGKTEPELPEARRGHSGATTVDGHPWIWNNFSKAGYVTQWVEDGVRFGTFTYRMLGFQHQPTDHYMRTFYLEADKSYSKYSAYCLGSQHRHNIMLNWLTDLFHAYPNRRKFSFGFHSECSHDGNNPLSIVDADLADWLKKMDNRGYLNQTLLIIMSDHGARFQGLRETVQGKYEERNPFFSIRLPPWFKEKYPKLSRNLRDNAKRLTTPFDIHETFHDVLELKSPNVGNVSHRGISLFSQIPRERGCKHADIEPHWCTCLSWRTIDPTSPIVVRAARHVVFHINRLMIQSTTLCKPLALDSVLSASVFTPNSEMLKFKKSADTDGRVPDLSGRTKPDVTFYQLQLTSTPGGGHFEITVKYDLTQDVIHVSEREISRTNKYGDAPACVAGQFPHLRPYCVC